MAADPVRVRNYINGAWSDSRASEWLDVFNPATAEVIGRTPLSPATEVDQAVQAVATTFGQWRRVPVASRAQCLF